MPYLHTTTRGAAQGWKGAVRCQQQKQIALPNAASTIVYKWQHSPAHLATISPRCTSRCSTQLTADLASAANPPLLLAALPPAAAAAACAAAGSSAASRPQAATPASTRGCSRRASNACQPAGCLGSCCCCRCCCCCCACRCCEGCCGCMPGEAAARGWAAGRRAAAAAERRRGWSGSCSEGRRSAVAGSLTAAQVAIASARGAAGLWGCWKARLLRGARASGQRRVDGFAVLTGHATGADRLHCRPTRHSQHARAQPSAGHLVHDHALQCFSGRRA